MFGRRSNGVTGRPGASGCGCVPSLGRNIGVTECPYLARMDVVLLRWPEESDRRTELETAARPRLLLVEPGDPPPDISDPLEDWIRLPADDRDVRARLSTLVTRSGAERPFLDADGLLWFRGRWVPLSPVERSLAEGLLERFGAVAGRDALRRRAWPDGLRRATPSTSTWCGCAAGSPSSPWRSGRSAPAGT